MTDHALADGVARITIEAENPDTARRLAFALQRVLNASWPTEPVPVPGEDHHHVRLYATPPGV